MKFCANLSLLFTDVELPRRFHAAKKAGFSAVEIQFPHHVPLDELQQAQQETNLEVILINVPAGDLMQGGEGLAAVPGKEQDFEQALITTMSYATALNVKCINVLPGRCFDNKKQDAYLTTFKDNLIKAADAFQSIGSRCTFEAINTIDMPNFLIHNTEQMHNIITELNNNNLYMQYDIYHMSMMGMDITNDLTRYIDKIGHIQFADMPGRGEPGTGKLPLSEYFELTEKLNYQGWLGAEFKAKTNAPFKGFINNM